MFHWTNQSNIIRLIPYSAALNLSKFRFECNFCVASRPPKPLSDCICARDALFDITVSNIITSWQISPIIPAKMTRRCLLTCLSSSKWGVKPPTGKFTIIFCLWDTLGKFANTRQQLFPSQAKLIIIIQRDTKERASLYFENFTCVKSKHESFSRSIHIIYSVWTCGRVSFFLMHFFLQFIHLRPNVLLTQEH